MADDRPDYSFSPGPPPEASRYLRAKALRPAFSWLDVEPEEHAVAFSVAKATKLDVLTAIREEVQRALDQGIPLEQFQRDLRPRLEKLGWWGARETIGKDGTRRTIQLGSPRRLRTIYDANIRSARAAGQWERIQRTKRAMPYLLYGLGPSERHRPHHESKAGLVLPVDDPFWATWMPPNGWGCKCWVRQITRREAETRGIEEAPAIETREWINARTGEVKQIPVGIDPGWERNPGLMRQQSVEQLLDGKLAAADPAVQKAAVRDIATSWQAERVLRGVAQGAVPIGVLPAEVAKAVGMRARVVRTTAEYGAKFVAKQRGVSIEQLEMLTEGLEAGKLLVEQDAKGKSLLVVTPGDQPWLFALKLLPNADEIWLRSTYRLKPSKWQSLMEDELVSVLRE